MSDVNTFLTFLNKNYAEDRGLFERAISFLKEAGIETETNYKTAETLAELHVDKETVVAGLLYNVLDSKQVDETRLQKEFGDEITFLIKKITELTRYRYQGLARHKESLRKLLLSISEDIRVLIIKLAERKHRFETLHTATPDKQLRTALETLEIYAPIANRLGMGRIKGELEDLAFPFVYPKEYKETKELFKKRAAETGKYVEKIYKSLQKLLYREGIRPRGADFRRKHLYSLYKKLMKYGMNIEKIYDIEAIRVIVATLDECYRVMGIIHGVWKPLPGRIKDYIGTPKPNGYQSLHTTVETGDGGFIEIQIRTEQMHKEAEYGIASHFFYKELPRGKSSVGFGKKFEWIKELRSLEKKEGGTSDNSKKFRADFFKDRVFIFTPRGDVVDLPRDVTPVDFAYAIHSEVGDHMAGAKINGKLSALDSTLQNGDVVEIVTKKGGSPSHKWLAYSKTAVARKHIKEALQKNPKT